MQNSQYLGRWFNHQFQLNSYLGQFTIDLVSDSNHTPINSYRLLINNWPDQSARTIIIFRTINDDGMLQWSIHKDSAIRDEHLAMEIGEELDAWLPE